MEIPRIGSAAVVVKDGKVLLGKRNKKNAYGKWVIPGGRVDWGETIRDAAVREIKEETGLDIKVKELLFHKEIIALHADYHRVVFFHLAEPLTEDITTGDDLSEAGFFTIDEIRHMDTVASVESVLRYAGLWKD